MADDYTLYQIKTLRQKLEAAQKKGDRLSATNLEAQIAKLTRELTDPKHPLVLR